MIVFGWWRAKRAERQFRVALTTLLAQYTFERLDERTQLEVEEQVRKVLLELGAFPAFVTSAPWRGKAAFYVNAMRHLGIEPAVAGEAWPDIGNLIGIRFLAANTRTAVKRAEQYLQGKGIDISSRT